jgi:hypothetical protein
MSWESADAYWGSLRERGFTRGSAPAFARIVLNAPAGAVTRALGLRGPMTLISGGPGATLAAVLHATEALARGHDADVLAVSSVAELGSGMCDDHRYRMELGEAHMPPGEVAASFVLARRSFAEESARVPLAVVAGVARSGPRRLAHAIRDALARGGVGAGEVEAVFGGADDPASRQRDELALGEVMGARSLPIENVATIFGTTENSDALALAVALAALERGCSVALVITDDAFTGSSAVVLRRWRP